MTKTTLKIGDVVRLLYLDGTLSPKTYTIHDIWGDETYARNASYIIEGTRGEEQHYHTDLMVGIGNVAPEDVPLKGWPVPDGGMWFIARGNNMGWGRANTIDTAISRMKSQGGKCSSYVVHKVSKWTTVDGMGTLTYPSGIDPVEVKRVEPKKKGAR